MTCININFDSLAWAFSADPKNFKDPTFFRIADRFFCLSEKYNFKYTIFIIGRDLENPEVASRVKEWHEQGHEIGNHSYSHYPNLGFLEYHKIESEVMRSHELISKICGEEPKGFIAPAWATSADLINILIKNGYVYDTSLFPSYFMWLASARVYFNFRNDTRRNTILQRKDWMANLFGEKKPFFMDGSSLLEKSNKGLLMIPLPVTPLLRMPCWHTMSFLLPRMIFDYILNSSLKQKYFYYLTHPADLTDMSDIPCDYTAKINVLERLKIPIDRKISMIDRYFSRIKNHSSKIVTMDEIARTIIAEKLLSGVAVQ